MDLLRIKTEKVEFDHKIILPSTIRILIRILNSPSSVEEPVKLIGPSIPFGYPSNQFDTTMEKSEAYMIIPLVFQR
jgi:hypothetical protein